MSLSLKTIMLRKKSLDNDIVQIASHLIQYFQLENNNELTVIIGKKSKHLKLEKMEYSADEIYLPESIFQEFCLPIQDYRFQANFQSMNNTLKLGPVIGLLTEVNTDEEGKPNFRSIHRFCEELNQGVMTNGGFFFVISHQKFPDQGYFFQDENWVLGEIPLPDVIYNRIHSRKFEFSYQFKQLLKKLEQINIPIFNERFLSKWEVNEHLMNEKHLQPFIPETKLFSYENFINFAENFETVFIKPVHGSQGRNIIKIEKVDPIYYQYQTSFPLISINSDGKYSLGELYQKIKSVMGNRIFIIQQGITLLSYDGSSMDFRALCHKDFQNNWSVTSLLGRISAEQEFVSNIARGGKMIRPLIGLNAQKTRQEAMEIIARIKELSIEIAAAICNHSTGITGELGIDIGIDIKGKPWLIEVNSKPSKNFEDGLMKIRPSAKAIIRFCRMLTFDPANE